MGIALEISGKKKRAFVAADFVVTEWKHLDPYFATLLDMPLDSVQDIESWLEKTSELEFVINEDKAWRFIRMTCDTENQEIKQAYEFFISEILPHLSVKANEVLKKLYNSPAFDDLDPEKYLILTRSTRNRIELFREENIPLLTEIRKRSTAFDEIAASLSVVEEGEKLTVQKAASLLENHDRAYRERIWRKITQTRLAHKDTLNELYTDLIGLRTKVAQNAGYDSFSDYMFARLGRFDYTREDCYAFHNSIEKAIRPQLIARSRERRANLGLDVLHHWDLNVDEFGRKPLRPFKSTDELIEKSIRIFDRLDPRLAGHIRTMREMGHLDLDSRLGKAPGGYNYPLPETGVPFIFMNAVGTQSDLTTMLHEAGHAVHSFATQHLDLGDFKHLPSEIAELASMSMELITLEFWDEFYEDPDDLRRAKREQLIRTFSLLPWIAAIDAYQFWAYDNPGHSVEEREAKWKEIFLRFHGDYIDWDGLEGELGSFWQKQGHVFDVPFYYIEYGFAQLGAIAVWRNYKEDPKKGMEQYLTALSMGYTRPIPEVYAAAGIRFDFSEDYIRELVDFLIGELKKLEG